MKKEEDKPEQVKSKYQILDEVWKRSNIRTHQQAAITAMEEYSMQFKSVPQSAGVWVKASERLPEKNGNYFCRIKYFYKDDEINNGAFNFIDGGFEIYDENEIVEWLDESAESVDKDKEIAEGRKEIERLKGLIEKAYKAGRNDFSYEEWKRFKRNNLL